MLFELVQGLFPLVEVRWEGFFCISSSTFLRPVGASPPSSCRPSTEEGDRPLRDFFLHSITSVLRCRTYRGSPGKCSSCRW